MRPILGQADSVLTDLETIMPDRYGSDQEELAVQRQEALASVPEIFPKPTSSG